MDQSSKQNSDAKEEEVYIVEVEEEEEETLDEMEEDHVQSEHAVSYNDFGDEDGDDDDGFVDDADFEDDDAFEDDEDGGDGWGDEDELCFDDQKRIEITEEEDCQAMLQRALEKRRLAQSKLEEFWKCGKCAFLLSVSARKRVPKTESMTAGTTRRGRCV